MSDTTPAPDIVSMRPFVPTDVFKQSLSFYADLGFHTRQISPGLAAVELGPFAFLLQEYKAEGFAANFMMHMVVNDLPAWWTRIEALNLAAKYGVREPTEPKMQPWGMVVTYIVDPGGVLWHIAQK